jgi:hypothetical protein
MTSHNGEGIHREGYDHWDRLGKASLPSPCGGEGRPAGIAQEGVTGAVARLPGQAAAGRGGDGSMRDGARLGDGPSAVSGTTCGVPPIYVKPFVRRQKNDAADAEAIAEAASRPTMRFVALKTEERLKRSTFLVVPFR